jgi:predicted nucleotidyltransferase
MAGGKMRFTRYLEELLGTKSDVKILRTLCKYPTKEFSESELARVSGAGQKSVNRAMPKYVSYGIASARTIGRANVYTLNSKHYVVGQLRSLFQAEDGAGSELKRLLENSFNGDKAVISLAIFGSVAGGREESTSDIDVFVITRHKERAKEKLQQAGETAMKKFGNVISGYILTPEEFERKKGTQTIKEIVAHGELIVGKPLGEK